MAVVQDLQEDVQHIGVGLFDLVKQHHGVGLAADLLGQLPGLVIADVTGGRADDPGDGVLLHELGHIQPDEGLRGVEQVLGQLLDQLGLAHAGGADEDEGDGLALGRHAHPVAPDGGRDGGNGLVLAHHVGLEPVLQLGQALVFLLLDGAGGDLRPQLDHAGEALQGQAGGLDGGQLLLLLEQLKLLAPQLGQALIGLVAGVGHHDLPLDGDVVQLLLQLQLPGQVLVPEVYV